MKKNSKTILYPAIFHQEADGKYSVNFLDIECATCGDSLENAFSMAKEALSLYFDDQQIVNPSPITKIKAKDGDIVIPIELELSDDVEYFRKSKIAELIEKGLSTKGYTKYQMAVILGVDRSYITHIVKGERMPSVEMAKRIATLLGFDWKDFFEN